MLRLRFTGAFKKDRKRAGRRGKTLDKLDDLMRGWRVKRSLRLVSATTSLVESGRISGSATTSRTGY